MRDLLADGTIDAWTAAQLWAALARRRSVVVVAEPAGAGKTTLLTALLEFLPSDTRRLYLRGCYEAFSFLADPEIRPDTTALLINEVSPHLPVYLWGPAVAQALEAGQKGFTLLATAHAESVTAFVGLLTGSPLRIPAGLVAVFEYVIVLAPSPQAASGRRVAGLWRLHPTPAGVGFAASPPLESFAALSPESLWFPVQELLVRFELLRDLADGRLATLPVVPSPQPADPPPTLRLQPADE
jgi:energy-coupling factor transporter ATP-binding protein EcfA2